MRLNPFRGVAPRFVALFALISLIAVGLITGSVLVLDHEARRGRAEEAARADLTLIAAKLKGALADPQAGPLIAGVIGDVDAYAGTATGRRLTFEPGRRVPPAARAARVAIVQDGTERIGARLQAPAGLLTATRRVESNGPLRPALIRYGGFASLLAVTLAAMAGLLVSRALTHRAAAMNRVFAAASGGQVGARVDATDGPVEFRTLAGNLNAMLDTLEHRLLEMRLSSDRMAHDLRTPLTRIATRLATIEAGKDPVARDAAGKARGEIDTLVGTLNALLDLREIETDSLLAREHVPLDAAIREAIDLYEAEAEDLHAITITADLEPIQLIGSAPLIVRAVANLLENALHAAPHGSTIAIRAIAEGEHAIVEICDGGAGFPATLAEQIECQAILHSGWGGHGLGLTIVRAVARRHHGAIALFRVGATTVARLTLRRE